MMAARATTFRLNWKLVTSWGQVQLRTYSLQRQVAAAAAVPGVTVMSPVSRAEVPPVFVEGVWVLRAADG